MNDDRTRGFAVYGIDIRNLKHGKYTTCPECSHTRKKKNDPCLQVYLKTGNWKCHHCGWDSHDLKIWAKTEDQLENDDLQKIEYDFKPQAKQKKVQLKERKPFVTGAITKSGQDLLKERGISIETAKACKVAQIQNWLVFNYYVNGKITNAKYRLVDKKGFKQHANCKNHLYGLDQVNLKQVVMCEGEFDKLAAFEAGIESCLSVSQGAPNVGDEIGRKLVCISNSIEYIKDVKKFVLAFDNDENGRYLTKYFIERFGANRCVVVKFPDDCKDLNDVLLKHGKENIIEIIKNAKTPRVSGAIFFDDEIEQFWDEFENGIEKGLSTGIDELEGVFSFYKGWTYLFHGIPNSGKSVFTLFLIMTMSVRYGWKWAVFTPEHFPARRFYRKAVKMLTGKNPTASRMSKEHAKKAIEFINKHFIVVYPEIDNESNNIDNVLKTVKNLKLTHDIDGYLIDPFNQLAREDSENIARYLEKALLKVSNTNKKHNLVGAIVAHPRTPQKPADSEDYSIMSPYQIDGGAMWYNKADVITAIHRPFNQTDKRSPNVDVVVQKVKDYDIGGEPDEALFIFNKQSGWYSDYAGNCALEGEFNKMLGVPVGSNGRPLDEDGEELPF